MPLISLTTPTLATEGEKCLRAGYFARSWALRKMLPTQMMSEAIRAGLTAPIEKGRPFGEVVGEKMIELASERGIETTSHKHYESVMSHAAIADLIVTTIRKPTDEPWKLPEPVQNWNPACYLSPDETTLRRIALVTHWSDERKLSECRSWFTLGEIAHYEIPMQLIVCVIGQQRDGLRRGPWSQAFQHPANKTIRFRKKFRSTTETFNEKWNQIRREDHAEISRETWLQVMMKDDVLPEVCFRIDIPVPDKQQLRRLRDMAERKMDRLQNLRRKPEANLSTCDYPVPCQFRRCCHVFPEIEPSERSGYVQISAPRSPKRSSDQDCLVSSLEGHS